MDVEIKSTHAFTKGIPFPIERAYGESAGYDLIACIEKEYRLFPNATILISSGIAIHIESENIAAFIFPRSGKGSKGLVLGNLTGVIDSGYQDEIKICLWNRTELPISVFPGEKVAQLVFMPILHPVFYNIGEREFSMKSNRGLNGFGSSDS
jgi:dUTP pyrophosphatase